ncbi:type II toxin-antitoxin system PemK/MazF family toxin [Pseudolabrys taiwanensis]|uniref:Type II toxin-antitoxin system PemK/MazF family toxin n=1 Tax=Pseudolabrys taiwanensis TaxID=331696 RepID=A0A345ZYC8_9HYPH|nr:type II toxin-antitoxin system PemK/MazF family toxin [Pseudolabrys taiwanensis]AXK81925.1 type II toxin-antitoxin system PemK/MazF family toxin [Pseudolabrys taiwanensis]
MKRGDVVLVLMQGDVGKPRPAVIVQSDSVTASATSVIICPMTSEIHEPGTIRPIVEPDAANGLRLRSQIMTDKLAATRADRVRRVLGAVDASTMERLDRALFVVLGLDR